MRPAPDRGRLRCSGFGGSRAAHSALSRARTHAQEQALINEQNLCATQLRFLERLRDMGKYLELALQSRQQPALDEVSGRKERQAAPRLHRNESKESEDHELIQLRERILRRARKDVVHVAEDLLRVADGFVVGGEPVPAVMVVSGANPQFELCFDVPWPQLIVHDVSLDREASTARWSLHRMLGVCVDVLFLC